jgi:Gluconate 2-dehydrogenase subunit 3
MNMKLSRREMLVGMAALGGASTIGRVVLGEVPLPDEKPFTQVQQKAVNSAVERILPGALDAGVPAYLDYWLGHEAFVSVRNYIGHGARHLDGIARRKHKVEFTALSIEKQDALLFMFANGKVKVGKFDGQIFFQQLVELTIEGFLSDPRYGGNRDGVGWKFIGRPDGMRSCWWNPKGVDAVLGAGRKGRD